MKKNIKSSLIITTINKPNRNIKRFSLLSKKKNWNLIIIGDHKSPKNFKINHGNYLDIIDQKRINVSFKKAGIIGPKLLGKKISFLSEIKKTQKGWLDTTVLSPDLRICKGYKGTTFALLKRNDLSLTEFFNA